jgi:hypothetical protein
LRHPVAAEKMAAMWAMWDRIIGPIWVGIATFFAIYLGLVIGYGVLFMTWGASHEWDAVPIAITALPLALIGSIVGAIFKFCWRGRPAD